MGQVKKNPIVLSEDFLCENSTTFRCIETSLRNEFSMADIYNRENKISEFSKQNVPKKQKATY